MRHRVSAAVVVLVLGMIALVASRVSTARAAASGQLSVIGPYSGSDAASFQEVLKGFMAKNPGVTVTYTAATGDVAAQLSRTSATSTAPLTSRCCRCRRTPLRWPHWSAAVRSNRSSSQARK